MTGAGLLLVDGTRVLLQRRANVEYAGTWSTPGGALERGETPTSAAFREFGEETGLSLTVRPLGSFPVPGWPYTIVLGTTGDGVPESTEALPEADALAWVEITAVHRLRLHPGFAAAWPHLRDALMYVPPPTEVHPGLWIAAAGIELNSPDALRRELRPKLTLDVCSPREVYAEPTGEVCKAFPLIDGPNVDAEAVEMLAESVAQLVTTGRPTMVRCHWGFNRSGLVVARALQLVTGADGESIVRELRRVRSPHMLRNAAFSEYLLAR